MSLKKYLKREALEMHSRSKWTDRQGQVFVEYFILFVVLAALTIAVVSKPNFFNQIKSATSNYTISATDLMTNDDHDHKIK